MRNQDPFAYVELNTSSIPVWMKPANSVIDPLELIPRSNTRQLKVVTVSLKRHAIMNGQVS